MNKKKLPHWFWNTSRGIRAKAVANIIIGLTNVGFDFLFIFFTKMCIDIATGTRPGSLALYSCLLTATALGNIALGFARRWMSALLGVKSQNLMQLRTFSRLMRSVWNGTERRHSGDVMNRLIRDANEITSVITDTLPQAICVGVRLLGAFCFLFMLDSKLACILILVAPIFFLLSKLYIRKMRTLQRDIRNTDSRIQSILQESLQHRMVIKALEQTEGMVSQLADTQEQLRKQVRQKTMFSSTSQLIVTTGFSAGYLLTFLWGVNRLYDHSITYGTMLAFIQLVGQIQGPFREMTRFIPTIISAITAGERMMELEEAPLEQQGEEILFTTGAGIRFTNVSYRYGEQERQILDHLSYDFTPGSTTAILGETGAGKTTLIRLILALLTPQEGQVTFYDHDGRKETASPCTRCNLVYVPQGNTLLSGTIRDNLLLGNPDATDEEMINALHIACADFVLETMQGLNMPCGEGGTGMSEGQAQRIAIARALLRKGCILLLDEATSALDIQTEELLLRNLTERTDRQQTVICITHRPAVVDYCTQVLRLERL